MSPSSLRRLRKVSSLQAECDVLFFCHSVATDAVIVWSRHLTSFRAAPLAQWLERWSYEPKVVGSTPSWSTCRGPRHARRGFSRGSSFCVVCFRRPFLSRGDIHRWTCPFAGSGAAHQALRMTCHYPFAVARDGRTVVKASEEASGDSDIQLSPPGEPHVRA